MRIVEERVIPAGSGRFTAGTAGNVKDFLDTVASYIPAEIIAAYTSANGLATVTKNPGFWYWVIFVVCAIGTPIYITRFANTPKEKWYNGIMATLAFLAWAYAMGLGLVTYLKWYDAPAGSIVLILFTVVSGFLVPKTKQPATAAQVSPDHPSKNVKE